jgi:integrase
MYLKRFRRSPYWYALFTGPDGRRKAVSTKEIEKARARKIGERYEAAAHHARLGFLAARQARKVIGDIFEISNREPLPSDTVKTFFEDWIATKKVTAGHKTYTRCHGIIREFLRWLAPARGNNLLAHLSSTDIAKFRDYLAKKHSPLSVNTALACIQAALQQAFSDNLVDVNEASRVKKMPEIANNPQGRRAFTDEELRKILKGSDLEWRGMVLCGAYHGLRLGDVALLGWPQVALESRELRFKSEKTGRLMVIPVAEPFYRYLMEIAGDDPRGPLFPRAFGLRQRKIPTSALSNQFNKILQTAGLVEKQTHKKKKHGPGRSGRRQSAGLGFHCLRHTATSLLKRAGASDVVAREIVGHETAAVSRTYSHIDMATLRGAIDKLPDITAE